MKGVADKEGLEFYLVRENPRNSDRKPNAKEREILQKFKAGETEFYELDHDAQVSSPTPARFTFQVIASLAMGIHQQAQPAMAKTF